MNRVEISHGPGLQSVQISANDICLIDSKNCITASTDIDLDLPVTITIKFQPFGIRPRIRYNGFLLDYWLANIMLYDHMVEFAVTENFYLDYKNKDIQGRLAHLSAEERMMDNLYDKYIGINNLYPELIQEIKNLLR